MEVHLCVFDPACTHPCALSHVLSHPQSRENRSPQRWPIAGKSLAWLSSSDWSLTLLLVEGLRSHITLMSKWVKVLNLYGHVGSNDKVVSHKQTLTDRWAFLRPLVTNTRSWLDSVAWVGVERTLHLRWGSLVFGFFWHLSSCQRTTQHSHASCSFLAATCIAAHPQGGTSRENPEIPVRLTARSLIQQNMSRIQKSTFFYAIIWWLCNSILNLFNIWLFLDYSRHVLCSRNEWSVIFHSSTLPLPLFPSPLGFPAQWHIMWLTMCLCPHGVGGQTQPVCYCLLTHAQLFHSVCFFPLTSVPSLSQCKETWKKPVSNYPNVSVHPHEARRESPACWVPGTD